MRGEMLVTGLLPLVSAWFYWRLPANIGESLQGRPRDRRA